MPRHDYCCPEHGRFEVMVPVGDDVLPETHCLAEDDSSFGTCLRLSPWVPPTVSFPGGPTTGARPPYIREDDDA